MVMYKHSKVIVTNKQGIITKVLTLKDSNKQIPVPLIDKYIETYQHRYSLRQLMG